MHALYSKVSHNTYTSTQYIVLGLGNNCDICDNCDVCDNCDIFSNDNRIISDCRNSSTC